MAIGFTPKHQEVLDLQDWNREETIVLAYEVAMLRNWKIQWLSPHGMIAFTGMEAFSWGSELTLKLESDRATVTSKSTGSEFADFGKNKKLVLSFLDEIRSLKGSYTLEQVAEKYQALTGHFPPPEEDLLILPPPTTSESIKSGLALLVPQGAYFVTPILVNINIIVFILMVVNGVHFLSPTSDQLLAWGANFKPTTLGGDWWRLITSCFIHIGVVHLLMNMFALVYIGMLLEPLLGRAVFLVAYLVSGITGSLASLWWHDLTVSAGASGAIFGLYGLFLVLLMTRLIEPGARKDLLTSVAIFVGYNLIYGLKGGVDNAAHIGGLIGGALFGLALLPELTKDTEVLQTPWKGGLAATLVILGFSAFAFLRMPNDIGRLEQALAVFSANEEKALQVLKVNENTPPEILKQGIRDEGIPAWKASITELEKMKSLNLPDQLQERNRLLIKYCQLRLQNYQRMYQALDENTQVYDSLLQKDNEAIEAVLKQIEAISK